MVVLLVCHRLVKSLRSNPAPYYAARLLLKETFPELLPDLEPEPSSLLQAFGQPKDVNPISYLGASKQATQCHFDNAENLVFVLDGTKVRGAGYSSTKFDLAGI